MQQLAAAYDEMLMANLKERAAAAEDCGRCDGRGSDGWISEDAADDSEH